MKIGVKWASHARSIGKVRLLLDFDDYVVIYQNSEGLKGLLAFKRMKRVICVIGE